MTSKEELKKKYSKWCENHHAATKLLVVTLVALVLTMCFLTLGAILSVVCLGTACLIVMCLTAYIVAWVVTLPIVGIKQLYFACFCKEKEKKNGD